MLITKIKRLEALQKEQICGGRAGVLSGLQDSGELTEPQYLTAHLMSPNHVAGLAYMYYKD